MQIMFWCKSLISNDCSLLQGCRFDTGRTNTLHNKLLQVQ